MNTPFTCEDPKHVRGRYGDAFHVEHSEKGFQTLSLCPARLEARRAERKARAPEPPELRYRKDLDG